jgi:hypothetical protein
LVLNKRQGHRRTSIRLAVVLIGLPLGFFLLAMWAVVVPQSDVKAPIRGVDAILQQDSHVDGWTLCGVLMAYSGEGRGYAVPARAAATFIATPLTAPCDDLAAWSGGLTSAASETSYSRYWFGPAILFRVASAMGLGSGFLDIQQGLVVAAVLLLAAAMMVSAGLLPTVGFLAPLMLATGFSVWSINPPYALPFSCACLFGAYLAVMARRNHRLSLVVVVASGMCVNYLDALSLPALYCLITVVPPLMVLWGVRRGVIRYTIFAIVMWYAGYAFAWLVKWISAMAIFDFDVAFNQLKGQVLFRVSGDVAPGEAPSRDTAIRGNVDSFLGNQYAVYLTEIAIALVIVSLTILILRMRSARWWRPAVSAAILAVLPFVTYVALSNHSTIHMWFTYRSLAGSVAVLLAFSLLLISRVVPFGDWSGSVRSRPKVVGLDRAGRSVAQKP